MFLKSPETHKRTILSKKFEKINILEPKNFNFSFYLIILKSSETHKKSIFSKKFGKNSITVVLVGTSWDIEKNRKMGINPARRPQNNIFGGVNMNIDPKQGHILEVC